MIDVKHEGDFNNLDRFLNRMAKRKNYDELFEIAGRRGVNELKKVTPKDTGKTASSWGYEVRSFDGSASITFTNHNITRSGTPVVILIEYGFTNRQGVYIPGREFINEAITPIFDKLVYDIWKEVTAK